MLVICDGNDDFLRIEYIIVYMCWIVYVNRDLCRIVIILVFLVVSLYFYYCRGVKGFICCFYL